MALKKSNKPGVIATGYGGRIGEATDYLCATLEEIITFSNKPGFEIQYDTETTRVTEIRYANEALPQNGAKGCALRVDPVEGLVRLGRSDAAGYKEAFDQIDRVILMHGFQEVQKMRPAFHRPSSGLFI